MGVGDGGGAGDPPGNAQNLNTLLGKLLRATQGLTLPVLDYGHDAAGGCSITGGYVYRGSAVPELQGRYFYSDFCSGWPRSFALVNGAATEKLDWNIVNVGQIVSFGADAQNELYMLSTSGKIYKIVRG